MSCIEPHGQKESLENSRPKSLFRMSTVLEFESVPGSAMFPRYSLPFATKASLSPPVDEPGVPATTEAAGAEATADEAGAAAEGTVHELDTGAAAEEPDAPRVMVVAQLVVEGGGVE